MCVHMIGGRARANEGQELKLIAQTLIDQAIIYGFSSCISMVCAWKFNTQYFMILHLNSVHII